MKLVLGLFACLGLQAQITFTPGGPDDYYCPRPTCQAGGTCLYRDNTMTPPTLLYGYGGASFTCTIPMAVPMVDVYLGIDEPTKTAAGQRVFTVTANGQIVTIDPFALAGLKNYTVVTMPKVVQRNGTIQLIFTSMIWNPLISNVTIVPSGTPLTVQCTPVGACNLSQTPPSQTLTFNPSVIAGFNTVSHDTPQGTIDGTNKVFTLGSTPVMGTEFVYMNGLLLRAAKDYQLTGNTLTFANAPPVAAVLDASYRFVAQ